MRWLLLVAVVACREAPDQEAEMARAEAQARALAERVRPRPEVVVAIQPGWTRIASEARLLLRDRLDVRVEPFLLDAPSETSVDAAVRGLPSWKIDAAAPRPVGDKMVWRGQVAIDKAPLAVLAWRCSSGRVAAIAVTSRSSMPLDHGLSLAETGRCLGVNEPAPEYPAR